MAKTIKPVIIVLFIALCNLSTTAFAIDMRHWSALSDQEKQALRIEAYAHFPEILQFKKHGKFFALNEWMAENKHIIHPNVRDIFRIKEDRPITWKDRQYVLPGIYATLIDDAPALKNYFNQTTLNHDKWLQDVTRYADYETENGTRVSEILKTYLQ